MGFEGGDVAATAVVALVVVVVVVAYAAAGVDGKLVRENVGSCPPFQNGSGDCTLFML
jgi:hypothetical protein